MNWLESFKRAIDQVDPEMRILLEKIEEMHWGKAEEREWIEKEEEKEVRSIVGYSTQKWEKAKRDVYAVPMNKADSNAKSLTKNARRDGLMAYMRVC